MWWINNDSIVIDSVRSAIVRSFQQGSQRTAGGTWTRSLETPRELLKFPPIKDGRRADKQTWVWGDTHGALSHIRWPAAAPSLRRFPSLTSDGVPVFKHALQTPHNPWRVWHRVSVCVCVCGTSERSERFSSSSSLSFFCSVPPKAFSLLLVPLLTDKYIQ